MGVELVKVSLEDVQIQDCFLSVCVCVCVCVCAGVYLWKFDLQRLLALSGSQSRKGAQIFEA